MTSHARSARLDAIRQLIMQAASSVPEIGPLEESVKWGEKSFAPVRPRMGSSVRLQPRTNGDIALMFICHTGLVDEFRAQYDGQLHFEGNRAIVVPADSALMEKPLLHCCQMALTYHLRKRKPGIL